MSNQLRHECKFVYLQSSYDDNTNPHMQRLLFYCEGCLKFMCKDYKITSPIYIENDPLEAPGLGPTIIT